MSARSNQRGHPIIWRDGQWVYENDGTSITEERPCIRCGEMPTVEGYDACLGHIEGVSSACCGHGVGGPYVMPSDGSRIELFLTFQGGEYECQRN